jgi:hypothetical protein
VLLEHRHAMAHTGQGECGRESSEASSDDSDLDGYMSLCVGLEVLPISVRTTPIGVTTRTRVVEVMFE